MLTLTPQKEELLTAQGNILVLGGPGSGKTTIALLKADREIRAATLQPGQRVLFLSFARATIARVVEQARHHISDEDRAAVEINTYHGFAWNLIRSHGYLLNAASPIRLLLPPEAASRLAETPEELRPAEKKRLFADEGLLHFDLFAGVGGELLYRSRALSQIICDSYPIIIVDEFQDTNSDEWQMIQALGRCSRLIALADAEQRIYEFRGADPRRIGEFIAAYEPTQFDFGQENNRSSGTDIVTFGNDLLTGANKTKTYHDVVIVRYGFYRGRSVHYAVKTTVLQTIKRQLKSGIASWCIAVLVPSKRLMLAVSDYLSATEDGLPLVNHDVAMDAEGPALAAILIGRLLEGAATKTEIAHRMILDLYTHIRGRKGGTAPNQGELGLAGSLGGYIQSGTIRGKKRKQVVDESIRIAEARLGLSFTGDPLNDWVAVHTLLANSASEPIQQVAEDAKYIRLLHKGALFRATLSELWRKTGGYEGASAAIRDALLQEHFSASTKVWRGIHVLTIHKAKGKEFDEVIIYDGSHYGRIIRADSQPQEIAQARLALRVAATRAKGRVTILTPKDAVCAFL